MVMITIKTLNEKKKSGEKFPVITAYDASFSRLANNAGIDVILVGDSLGNVIQGHDSTIPTTINDMVYHTQAVRRGSENTFIITDLPFMTFSHEHQALNNSAMLMRAGANMVKLEGGSWLNTTVRLLCERGIPVCGHLGLTPQSVHKISGNKVQGRTKQSANQIFEDALNLEKAGIDLLVLECVPAKLAQKITQKIQIPVIGIGAGVDTDGQVLVIYDILGLSPRMPSFSKNFLNGTGDIESALKLYSEQVRSKEFPAKEHTFS
ncbi:MAG: 3-methyl-2-oxobutanoate hydroxymethyltransferase [Cellvibrionales bacterium]|jgi:3-methyl-2-oxobutanoate hydroxymethyltransferase|nr:3-methyl-2-oxobutanoate hydroxymethyltransferase [Cellvibrionales bacterium]